MDLGNFWKHLGNLLTSTSGHTAFRNEEFDHKLIKLWTEVVAVVVVNLVVSVITFYSGDRSSNPAQVYISQTLNQRTFIYFERGSIAVQLTSCLTGLDLTNQVNLLLIQQKQSSSIQTNKTGDQSYCDTSPYKASE